MGPLTGLRVVELQGIGPGPFCGMMLADMGAEIIRVDRSAAVGSGARSADVLARGRKSIAVDLKNPQGVETVLKLVETADVLLEGFRPGVTERLGLGPDVCLERNPKLVYGRMTGWGRPAPWPMLRATTSTTSLYLACCMPLGSRDLVQPRRLIWWVILVVVACYWPSALSPLCMSAVSQVRVR